MKEILSQWAAMPVINGVGYATRVGGSNPSQEVREAMSWAQQHFFEMDDLLRRGSEIIARETGAEAGLVTCSASASLTLGAAAILVGMDIEAMDALPDVSRLKRNRFLYPLRTRYDYDHPVRASGGILQEFDFRADRMEERLEAALNEQIAGVVFVWIHRDDLALIRRIASVCRSKGIPFLLDAAMGLPPEDNLRGLIQTGAHLIALSGGKHLGGPQNSGLLFGESKLITSAWLQMVDMDVREESWSLEHLLRDTLVPRAPRHGIGRGFKVGKDALIGCLTALEIYSKRDFVAERSRWHTLCAHIANTVSGGRRYVVRYVKENSTGQYPVVEIEAATPAAMAQLKRLLKSQNPKIILAESEECHELAFLYPMCLSDEEVPVLIKRLNEAMRDET